MDRSEQRNWFVRVKTRKHNVSTVTQEVSPSVWLKLLNHMFDVLVKPVILLQRRNIDSVKYKMVQKCTLVLRVVRRIMIRLRIMIIFRIAKRNGTGKYKSGLSSIISIIFYFGIHYMLRIIFKYYIYLFYNILRHFILISTR